jgi:hypothetical protein
MTDLTEKRPPERIWIAGLNGRILDSAWTSELLPVGFGSSPSSVEIGTRRDIGPDDVVIFANGEWTQKRKKFNAPDLDEPPS